MSHCKTWNEIPFKYCQHSERERAYGVQDGCKGRDI